METDMFNRTNGWAPMSKLMVDCPLCGSDQAEYDDGKDNTITLRGLPTSFLFQSCAYSLVTSPNVSTCLQSVTVCQHYLTTQLACFDPDLHVYLGGWYRSRSRSIIWVDRSETSGPAPPQPNRTRRTFWSTADARHGGRWERGLDCGLISQTPPSPSPNNPISLPASIPGHPAPLSQEVQGSRTTSAAANFGRRHTDGSGRSASIPGERGGARPGSGGVEHAEDVRSLNPGRVKKMCGLESKTEN